MRATVRPGPCRGAVTIPPSKSLSHRAVICACLAPGESLVRHAAASRDLEATIAGMRCLGARIERRGDDLLIQGGNPFRPVGQRVDCGESGSTLRFFIPLFALSGAETSFTGQGRLLQRPQQVYAELFRQRGLTFEQGAAELNIAGALTPGHYALPGDVSSQFITGLLLALPLLPGDSLISIRPPFESRSYVGLTLEAMAAFGVQAYWVNPNELRVPGGQSYRAGIYEVPGDDSQMAFFAVLGAIAGEADCLGVARESRQGDRVILDILRRFGAEILPIPGGFRVRRGELRGGEIDLSDCPDLGPILTVLGMYARGQTRIYNAGRLRYKESDRIAAMEAELGKLGAHIRSGPAELCVWGEPPYAGGTARSQNDHRVAMSLAVAAAAAAGPVTIEQAEAVQKSYPGFFTDLQALGIEVRLA